jgi:hypothetical protein
MTTIRRCFAPMIIIGIIGLLDFKYFEFECLLIKLYKYECCTITGIWKQGSAYFVVKPINMVWLLTWFKAKKIDYQIQSKIFLKDSLIFDNVFFNVNVN